MDSEAVVMARGRRPPVRSFAWTEMSGEVSGERLVGEVGVERKEEDEARPRRYKPVKTSSAMKGRPDQDFVSWDGMSESGFGGEEEGVLGAKSKVRTTLMSVRWKSGSTKIMPPAPMMMGSRMRAPNLRCWTWTRSWRVGRIHSSYIVAWSIRASKSKMSL